MVLFGVTGEIGRYFELKPLSSARGGVSPLAWP